MTNTQKSSLCILTLLGKHSLRLSPLAVSGIGLFYLNFFLPSSEWTRFPRLFPREYESAAFPEGSAALFLFYAIL